MFLLFGISPKTTVIGETKPYTCGRCRYEGPWKILKIQNWFSLFFIPLFPVSTRYIEQCPRCGGFNELTKEQAEANCVIHS
ncbi:MAG: zinc-ribbon domain-containing protein [Bulleidia sp.]|nr:zinc-ribbon domain-containing protein [Bulleidia sp.]